MSAAASSGPTVLRQDINSLFAFARLALALWLFARTLPRRRSYNMRLAGVLAVASLIAAVGLEQGFSLFPELAGQESFLRAVFQFVAVLLCAIAAVQIPFRATIWTALFCSSAAYTLQSLAGGADRLGAIVVFEFFGRSSLMGSAAFLVVHSLAMTALVFGLCWSLMIRRLEAEHLSTIEDRSMLLMMALVVLFDIVFDLVVSDLVTYPIPRFYFFSLSIVQVSACILTLAMEYEILYSRHLSIERETANRLRQEQAHQYAITKETIGAINARCHAIRHELFATMLDSGALQKMDPDALADIARHISIYDSTVHTGNDVLDTVLTEKRLICRNQDIELSCIADGQALGFLADADLYALVSGLLDGAMQDAREAQASFKSISLTIRKTGAMAAVHLEQSFPRTPGGSGALVDAVIQSCHGSLELAHDRDIWLTDVLLPIPGA